MDCWRAFPVFLLICEASFRVGARARDSPTAVEIAADLRSVGQVAQTDARSLPEPIGKFENFTCAQFGLE